MQLKPEQLPAQLKQTLAPVWLISGDEPLQLLECCDRIRKACREQGFEERVMLEVDKQFDWNRLMQENMGMSLFGGGKLIELRLGTQKPGREGSAAIVEYLQNSSPDNVLLISSQRLDKSAQNGKWFKAIAKAGVTIACWPIKENQLPDWIQQRSQLAGKTIEFEAAQFLAEKVEGNLLAARQEIDKLQLLVDDEVITLQHVLDAIVDNSRYDIFAVIEAACVSDLDRVRRMLQGLRSEGHEPMELYPALMWEFRRLCNIAREQQQGAYWDDLMFKHRVFDQQRKQALRQACKKHPASRLQQMLAGAIRIERTIKSRDKDLAWNELLNFLAYLAGFNLKLKNQATISL